MFKKEFLSGIRDGLPVGVGYFAVSFGFGISALSAGIKILEATIMSLTNLTSAGQFAALSVIATAAPLINMFITEAVINSRYALMSLALSQRLGSNFGTLSRLLVAFINTDEIFAISMARPVPLTKPYMLGLGTTPIIGWTLGTFTGAFAGSILPASITAALSLALYGMFVAIVVPNLRKEKSMVVAAVLACALSCLFALVPVLKALPGGIGIVVTTLVSAGICAALFAGEEEI